MEKFGTYKINFKLIDRENSDSIIAEKSFDINVVEDTQTIPETTENPTNQTVPTEEKIVKETSNDTNKQLPKTLPKAGKNLYLLGSLTIISLIGIAIYYNKSRGDY